MHAFTRGERVDLHHEHVTLGVPQTCRCVCPKHNQRAAHTAIQTRRADCIMSKAGRFAAAAVSGRLRPAVTRGDTDELNGASYWRLSMGCVDEGNDDDVDSVDSADRGVPVIPLSSSAVMSTDGDADKRDGPCNMPR
jgi:hypothetical protein